MINYVSSSLVNKNSFHNKYDIVKGNLHAMLTSHLTSKIKIETLRIYLFMKKPQDDGRKKLFIMHKK